MEKKTKDKDGNGMDEAVIGVAVGPTGREFTHFAVQGHNYHFVIRRYPRRQGDRNTSIYGIPARRARDPSVELVESVYCYLETSKPEYSLSWFGQGVDHRGSTNCNAKIVNQFLEVVTHSHARLSHVLGKVDTPKLRYLKHVHCVPRRDEIRLAQVLARHVPPTATSSTLLGVEPSRANLEKPSRNRQTGRLLPGCLWFFSNEQYHPGTRIPAIFLSFLDSPRLDITL
ncbi:hypothetical protein CRG98_039584 [Punica granatum]|uniref:Uncharacterized protein n=1 Tax=Punica granatum TaxID=22663 RepID=A0A2I0I7N4_PUNGR|nr:hypothetical protein CRG98_039584 [Punica granatum]